MTTTAYVDAGLPAPDTSTSEPSATTAYVTAGIPSADPPHSGYELCMGASEDNIDTDNPVALMPPGKATVPLAGLGLAEDTDHWFGLLDKTSAYQPSALSNIVRVRIESGSLIGPKPNPLTRAVAKAIAGGDVRVKVHYNTVGAPAAATSIKIAKFTNGAYDWSTPAATIAIGSSETGSLTKTVTLAETFSHGQTVKLAARAVTAAGATGDAAVMIPVVADTTAPAAIASGVTAEQYDD